MNYVLPYCASIPVEAEWRWAMQNDAAPSLEVSVQDSQTLETLSMFGFLCS